MADDQDRRRMTSPSAIFVAIVSRVPCVIFHFSFAHWSSLLRALAMPSARILVIEDDPAIRRGVVDALRFAGYEPAEAADGSAGLSAALNPDYDLVLLDLVLPGPDGLTILKRVRAARPAVPVIVLTAKGAEDDRVRGLRLGADDYVVKPFGIRELLARIEAVLRRVPARPDRIRFPGGVADFDRREVQFDDGECRELSERELALLGYLARHSGRAVSREEILAEVWGLDPVGITTRTIDMHIARLREKLRDDPDRPHVVITVRGRGYMLAAGASTA
jgi:DNA-binding response OmpR family regulator